jgi:uncharacterized protein RhaS with RHS repeats
MHLKSNRLVKLLLCASSSLVPVAAYAGETTTYSYDALGRLTKAASSGTVNNGMDVSTQYDAAGNRSTHQVTGAIPAASGGGAGGAVVVVPLNGYTVIPLPSGNFGL